MKQLLITLLLCVQTAFAGNLFWCGFESKQSGVKGADVVDFFQGTPTYVATANTGSWAMRCTGTQMAEFPMSADQAAGRTWYMKFHLYVHAYPTGGDVYLAGMMDAGTSNNASMVISTTGTIYCAEANGTHIGNASPALSLDTWYYVELKYVYTGGAIEGRLNGTAFGSGTATASTANHWLWIGNGGLAGSGNDMYFDDIVLNDDQGTSQNNYPGNQKINFLRPTSDNRISGGWVNAGSSSNLYLAVINVPPIGATVHGTNKLVTDSTSGTTDTVYWNCATYTSLGIQTYDTVNYVQQIIRTGECLATSTKAGAMGVFSNPSISVSTFNFDVTSGVHGNEIGNWQNNKGTITYNPTITLGGGPIIWVKKTSALTTGVAIDMAALMVSWTPGSAPPPASGGTIRRRVL